MAHQFEIDADFDSVNEFDDSQYIADFRDPFKEEEFEAMGINPFEPTDAKPGSSDKVVILAARYAAGLPLWHEDDCYDHAPADVEEEDDDLLETDD